MDTDNKREEDKDKEGDEDRTQSDLFADDLEAFRS